MLSLLATVFAPAKFAVHRAVSPVDDPKVISKLKLVRGSVSPLRATFCILLAIGLNLHDYFTPWHSLLAGAAVTLRMAMQLVAPISTRRATVVSLRGVIIVLLAWIALSAILSAVFIAMALAWSWAAAGDDGDEGGNLPMIPEPRAAPSGRTIAYAMSLMVSLWPAAIGVLAATAYRFDFHMHQQRMASEAADEGQALTKPSAALETVDAPLKRCCRRRRRCSQESSETTATAPVSPFSRGVVIPSLAQLRSFVSSPRSFKRPYFHSVVCAYTLVQIGLAMLLEFNPYQVLTADLIDALTSCDTGSSAQVAAEDKWCDGEMSFQLLSTVLLSVPACVVALIITACIRHEWYDMWTYSERWGSNKGLTTNTGTIRLEGQDEALLSNNSEDLEHSGDDDTPPPVYTVSEFMRLEQGDADRKIIFPGPEGPRQ